MKSNNFMEHIQSTKAVAAVEFALILPILLIILFATVELSTLLYDKSVITNAGREATRAGIVSSSKTDAEIQAYVQNYCLNRLITFGSNATPTVTITRPLGSSSGNPLIVTVTYSFTGLVLGQLVQPKNWTQMLTSTTIMNYE
ncbi:TadE/TadG family type IV pilus assembly protein [Polynucleobacter kasalickyi]|uniref:TadE-like protein n=1 Tax=Polynucleobacter kasalickyi TaxID=1938817 RepID=A0A1W1Y437_9BURK|nr:TadE/TadG family type IV pilus assembly protein [Polynucleobacter kasalickyi]SMC30915.1 TadE-like protein [Polynucleobacter kasalickyi]